MISSAQREQFDEQGYLVVRGLLDVGTDIDPFKANYAQYLDTLADILLKDAAPALRASYDAQPFPARFAMLLGCTGGALLHHLDPILSVLLYDYRLRSEWPPAQHPELFRLIRTERLLDALEGLLGPEITSSPIYHFNLKLNQRHRQIAVKVADMTGQSAPGLTPNWKFHVGTAAGWHSDAPYGMADAHQSRIVNAWIPLTPATTENACLVIAPGSHRLKHQMGPVAVDIGKTAVPLPVQPGDVIFLHNNIAHTALDYRAADGFRWAFNFRYLPTGEPTGRPFLPEFIARSHAAPERELRDGVLWGKMWGAALDYLSGHRVPKTYGRTLAEAEAITARWRAATPNYADWLNLPPNLIEG